MNLLDLAKNYQLVAPVASSIPKWCWKRHAGMDCAMLGSPEQALTENGGEFKHKFSSELESLGVKPLRTTAVSPTQNAACERAGATWNWQR